MRRPFRNLLMLGFASAALAAAAFLGPWRGWSPRPAPVSKVLGQKPLALAPGIYILGASSPAAVYLVETSAGLVLIDSGVEDHARSVLGQLRELNFDVKQLKAILLTHTHADHSHGAAYLRELTGARVYAGRPDAEALRRAQPREAFTSIFHMPALVLHATTVDVELSGEETIDFGETSFTALAAPGHTKGSMCYLLKRQGLTALFAGDMVLHLGEPQHHRLGTYTAYLSPRYGGNVSEYLGSLRRLRHLPVPDLVLPGHPQLDAAPQSPRVTEEKWFEMVDRGIAELETLAARYTADGPAFLDGTPRELLPGLHYLGDFAQRAVYCLATAHGLFLVDAPGGPSLLAFLTTRLKALGHQPRDVRAVLLTSADDEATAGLHTLVAHSGCVVVAPATAREQVRGKCPPGSTVINEDKLKERKWLDVTPIALAGLGTAPIAYQLKWTGKTVLISGRMPLTLSDPFHLRGFTFDPGKVSIQPSDYLTSLMRLAEITPDLWLPSTPVDGQNANLYNGAWRRLMEENMQLARWLNSSAAPVAPIPR